MINDSLCLVQFRFLVLFSEDELKSFSLISHFSLHRTCTSQQIKVTKWVFRLYDYNCKVLLYLYFLKAHIIILVLFKIIIDKFSIVMAKC